MFPLGVTPLMVSPRADRPPLFRPQMWKASDDKGRLGRLNVIIIIKKKKNKIRNEMKSWTIVVKVEEETEHLICEPLLGESSRSGHGWQCEQNRYESCP